MKFDWRKTIQFGPPKLVDLVEERLYKPLLCEARVRIQARATELRTSESTKASDYTWIVTLGQMMIGALADSESERKKGIEERVLTALDRLTYGEKIDDVIEIFVSVLAQMEAAHLVRYFLLKAELLELVGAIVGLGGPLMPGDLDLIRGRYIQ